MVIDEFKIAHRTRTSTAPYIWNEVKDLAEEGIDLSEERRRTLIKTRLDIILQTFYELYYSTDYSIPSGKERGRFIRRCGRRIRDLRREVRKGKAQPQKILDELLNSVIEMDVLSEGTIYKERIREGIMTIDEAMDRIRNLFKDNMERYRRNDWSTTFADGRVETSERIYVIFAASESTIKEIINEIKREEREGKMFYADGGDLISHLYFPERLKRYVERNPAPSTFFQMGICPVPLTIYTLESVNLLELSLLKYPSDT